MNRAFAQRQFLAMTNIEFSSQRQLVVNNGIDVAYLIYQNYFVDNKQQFNRQLMEKSLNTLIPDKNAAGYAYLDWEGEQFYIICGYTNISIRDIRFKRVLNNFIEAIRYAKSLRPNLKWSYYSMPPQYYSTYVEGAEEAYFRAIAPLMMEMDFLAPSLYLFDEGKSVDVSFVAQQVDDYLKFSLEWGKKLNKPIYPFIWERFAPFVLGSRYQNPNKLMPVDFWKAYVKRVLTTKNFSNQVNGLFWWHCTDYLYKDRAGDPIITAEFSQVTDPYAYQNTVFQQYWDSIKSILGY